MKKILVSDCCGVERGTDPDICPKCGGVCVFGFMLKDFIDEPNLDEIEPDEETPESLTGGEPPSCGLSDEDELKANFEDLPDEEDDRDEPNDPDFDVDSSMEDRISQYEDKYSDFNTGSYR